MRLLAVVVLLSLSSSPLAAQTGDPAAGKRLAETVCAECHAIAPDSKPKRDVSAPSFVDISKMPSTTALSINVFLRTPHKKMPDLILSPEEIDSVSAYILSLSGK